ncbi:ethanolamine ammonia-lyase subunit EutC [Roseateles chitosanitabidus]|jgi:ethanolamine ammonia-lyase small subunit|uniref:ethanolamine ammonia-lyase subunit EutC n=1 Tax=Roseateles chitosanitabidus TaxID=65048 RepID=UPI0008352938|nr:ethanolamine ammonia-lyase subunit EutC [Roseateles chitosanitabidus]MBO9689165.1 ethanolamine ammonia-lyase subunit EutC [Roseateles chitosanitabidus]
MSDALTPNPWHTLRRHTPARIGLGRAGVSQPTAAHLAFQLAHAQARDAVHRALDHVALAAALNEAGLATIDLHSAAADRAAYLQRPDLGRRLDDRSMAVLSARDEAPPPDLALVVADGLSALAVERHALAFIEALRPRLADGWRWSPVAIARQARVAIGDPIGQALGAKLVVVLIGERPGLSSPDSMGVYVTWAPRPGRVDAERNCISNVRPEGLAPDAAAARLAWLLNEARTRQVTGVALKEESGESAPSVETREPFRLGGR